MRARELLLIPCALVCFGGAVATTVALEERGGAANAGQELMYFPSGELLRGLAVGNELMAADLVWLRGVQYYGKHRLTDRQFPWIGHIFDIATRLDPHFINAYVFGALVLAGEGGDAEGAIAFMKRGLAHNPESYLLAFEIGFLYHVTLSDFPAAARYYQRAVESPGCPEYVKRFAAFAWQQSAEVELALNLWEELAETSTHPAIRAVAMERADQLKAMLAREVSD